MTLDELRQSLTATKPPAGLTLALTGLWWDGKGDWKRAHESAQQDEGAEGSWVHAYLHRKVGDQDNAAYWSSGGQARVPGAAGCGMARYSERFAWIIGLLPPVEKVPRSCPCKVETHRVAISPTLLLPILVV